MIESIKIAILVSLLGGISSGIGGILTSIFRIKSMKCISSLQQITAGIMTGIVCFDMLPEAFEISNIFFGIIGVIIGINIIYFLDKFISNKKKYNNRYVFSIVIMLSMALHNIIEGFAIGASFSYSISMGIAVIVAIILHDIPEGVVVGISNNIAGKNKLNNILNTIIVGIVTGIGALFGNLIGNIGDIFISISLCIAAGVMLYIISCELMPESHITYSSKKINISYIIGIIVGAMIVYM